VIAPKAPPVSQTADGLQVAMTVVLDAADVLDTLTALRGRAARTDTLALAESETFTFGIRDVGRIRVSYITQRGTKVVRISRIPSRIPDPDAVCEDPAALDRLFKAISSPQGGFLAVWGPSCQANSLLVYALLGKVNRTQRRLLYILERALSFLMAHGNSIVVQAELNAEVKTLQRGLDDALLREPDLIYVGDIRPDDDLPMLVHAIHSRIVAVVSSVTMDGSMLLRKFAPAHASPQGFVEPPACAVRVTPAAAGRVSVEFTAAPAAN